MQGGGGTCSEKPPVGTWLSTSRLFQGNFKRKGYIMHDSHTLPASSYRHGRQKHDGRKCNCCPYGYHIDLDFVRYCEKVANSQLLGSHKKALVRPRTVRKKRESIESLLGLDAPTQNLYQLENADTEGKKEEKKNEIFFDEFREAVLDFELMCKNTSPNKTHVRKKEEVSQYSTLITNSDTQPKDLFESEVCSSCKSNGSCSESAVRLQEIRTQMAASLKRMKELEDEVKLMPQLKNQLKKLCWENKHLIKLLELKEERTEQIKKEQFKGVHTRTIGTSCNILQRNVAVSTNVALSSKSTCTESNFIIKPIIEMKHVQTNIDFGDNYFNSEETKKKSPEQLFFLETFKKTGVTKNIGIQVETPSVLWVKKNVSVQVKPLCSSVFVHTELHVTDTASQTSKILKKDVGVEINAQHISILKCDIGTNTENAKKVRCFTKYSDTMDLLKTADVSVNTAKKKRVDASVETCEKIDFPHKKIEHLSESKKNKKDIEETNKLIVIPNPLRNKCNEKAETTDEIQEKKFPSIPVVSKRLEKKEPTKEMKGAMKVLNDFLQKSASREMPYNMKNAINIIQQEWFKVSSTAEANPLDVEDYLDCFEELSVTLLEYIVNMTDVSGNTAMHYAVSNGNFDVVSILLDSKVCNINKLNAAGYTCIMLVALTKVKTETDRQVVRRLFHMADVNIRAKQHGQTALMLAVSHGRIDTVQLLLESGADINIQDEDGSTALMCAAEHGYIDIVKILLAQPDCDLSITDLDGNTALAIAMEAGNRDIGVLLYAQEHFSRTNSPFGSLKIRRAKSATPTLRTRSPTPPNCSLEHSL
ncbi:KN motif and ankyrin repeat domain-containing protein 3 isoform X2 [Halyomorpha halys]|uniref:KN motif and ankyrin repeat domain-containing protein 3 isoform X2 n=1 Tax=Halyomorpha halys TaxID=286706 RepID=UPI0006D4D272|nr:uncharacterized protein LOC106690958 isoform X2 [Halyomorpha halys]